MYVVLRRLHFCRDTYGRRQRAAGFDVTEMFNTNYTAPRRLQRTHVMYGVQNEDEVFVSPKECFTFRRLRRLTEVVCRVPTKSSLVNQHYDQH